MKKIVASVGIAISLAALGTSIVSAKSIKYSCVEVSPAHFVCTGSTNRP
jgi:hypothetical protein